MRCQHYRSDGVRCRDEAARWMIGPDGVRVPGAVYCKRHTEDTLREYQAEPELVGGRWSSEPVDEYGAPSAQMQGDLFDGS